MSQPAAWAWGGYAYTRTEPRPTEAVTAAIPIVRAALDAGEDYGACHIVLADVNIEREHVQSCRDQVNITAAGAAAMDAMLAMSMRERALVLAAVRGDTWLPIAEAEFSSLTWDDEAAVDRFEDEAGNQAGEAVRCDAIGCEAEVYVEREHDGGASARDEAAAKGWGYRDGMDLCPTHIHTFWPCGLD